ncbi:MAG TPA: HAMP domain-containing sensor histidine kinase [Terriglobales bacterium]|nr:HAMP domain-containing sensor histidine kinase [Terriglobales bacterium]
MAPATASATRTSPPPSLTPRGLPDDRLRLAFINQYRELVLGAMAAVAAGARLLGAAIPGAVIILLILWSGLALSLTRFSRKIQEPVWLYWVEFTYFAAELTIITRLALSAGAAEWLTLLFYVVTVLFASIVLPRRLSLCITVAAAACFAALLTTDAMHAPHHWRGSAWADSNSLFLHRGLPHPAYLAPVLFLGALGGYALIGLTLAQFSRMLNRQTVALHQANRDLSAAGQEIRLHRDHLEDLVRERTAELERANRELVHLNEMKSNFLANVSHELRTPLTSIRSFSEILLDYPEEDVFTRCEFLEIIIHESDRLTRLVNDVLDLAKIESGKMEWRPEPVDFAQVVRESLEAVRMVAAHKKLSLRNTVPDPLPQVLADRDRLRQVLTNLLSNALKFTSAGSVAVGARIEGDELVASVADTGIGIPPEAQQRIFEKFHQEGDALMDKPPGTGLGLAICREILAHLHGRIWVESEPGKGSVFFFALPLAGRDPGDNITRPAAHGRAHKTPVLG